MRALQNQIHTGLGISLATFDNLESLKEVEAKFHALVDDHVVLPRAPTSLTLMGDEQSAQWSSFNYTTTKLNFCVATMNDPFHRLGCVGGFLLKMLSAELLACGNHWEALGRLWEALGQ